MRRKILTSTFVLIFVLCAIAVPQKQVKADSGVTAYDLIALVNSIRTNYYGLPALIENPYLDAEAQWTADEMVSINAYTHLYYMNMGYPDASARAASVGFGGGKKVFVTENWYAGYNATISGIQDGWADELHMLPMTKAEYMYVGAGKATTSDGKTYYVLQAGYISGESVAATSDVSKSGATTAPTSNISDWIAAVYTNTPSPDGYIYHVVQANQVLSDIAAAYGVTVDYLVELNNLSSPDAIYAGQKLIIKAAPTATVTLTPTPTELYPTHTPTLNVTATPLATRTPTPKPSLIQQLPKMDRSNFGFLLVLISFLGLALVIVFNFVKLPKKPAKPPEPEPTPEPQNKAFKNTGKPAAKTTAKKTSKTSASKTAAKPVAKSPTKKPVDAAPHQSLNIPVKTSKKTTKK